jgi:hypothetical protein
MATISGALGIACIKKENTPGTYAAPTTADHGFLLVDSLPTGELEAPKFLDESLRADLRSRFWDSTKTTEKWTLSLEGPFTLGSGGHLLMAAMGLDASTNGGSGTVYTHTLSANTAYPPCPTYSIYTFDGANSTSGWGYVGCVLNELSITVDGTDGVARYSASFMAVDRASQTALSIAAESGANFGKVAGVNTAVLVGGTTDTGYESVTYTFNRGSDHRHTLAGQATPDVANRHNGPLTVTASASSFYDSSNGLTRFNYFKNNANTSFKTVIGSTVAGLTLEMTSPAWTAATVAAGGPDDIHRLDVELTGLYSTTDAGPVAVTLVNGRTAAY